MKEGMREKTHVVLGGNENRGADRRGGGGPNVVEGGGLHLPSLGERISVPQPSSRIRPGFAPAHFHAFCFFFCSFFGTRFSSADDEAAGTRKDPPRSL